MEASVLFFSELPSDVVKIIYWETCKLKAIPDDLKCELLWFHKYVDILELYRKEFSNDSGDDDFYLYWLENNLVLTLNDYIPTVQGVSPELRREYPFITCEFLHDPVPSDEIKCRTFRLWSMFNIHKKVQFMTDLYSDS